MVTNRNSLQRLLCTDRGYVIYARWPTDPGVVYISTLGGRKEDKVALINHLSARAHRLYTHAAHPLPGGIDPYGFFDLLEMGFVPGLAGNPADEPPEMGFRDYIRNLVTLNRPQPPCTAR
jgi:hypothetical protein